MRRIARAGFALGTIVMASALPVAAMAGEPRELSTDRPDRTESPYTLEAGRIQIEADLVAHTRDRRDGETMKSLAVATSNWKLGIASNADLQLVLESWNREIVERPGVPSERRAGFGDVTARLKINLHGNDDGPMALAVMPFAIFPTSRAGFGREAVEGGVIVPLALTLPSGFGLGVMAEGDAVRDGETYCAEWIASATVAHEIAGSLAGYLELYGSRQSGREAPWLSTFDAGLTLRITPDLQVDAGFNAGLTDASEDLTVFVGFSARH